MSSVSVTQLTTLESNKFEILVSRTLESLKRKIKRSSIEHSNVRHDTGNLKKKSENLAMKFQSFFDYLSKINTTKKNNQLST